MFQMSSVDRPYQGKDQMQGGERSGKRLASAIVTPVRQQASMEDNVTEEWIEDRGMDKTGATCIREANS
ncbi:hypothetical protein YC2023_109258 [Brassica napus]